MRIPGCMRFACMMVATIATLAIIPLSAIGADARSDANVAAAEFTSANGGQITAAEITAAEITDVGLVTVDGVEVYAVDVTLDAASTVRLTLIEITGREIAELAAGAYDAGTHRFSFEPSVVEAGMYRFVLTTDDDTAVFADCACTN